MELRHLRYFSAVAQHLNFSEASRRLHVAQTAISKTILDLERELGHKLFNRTRRSVQLSAAGATFLREIEEVLRRADEAKRLSQRAARGELGSLRIAFLGPATTRFLPQVVQTYRKKYPDVELQLQHMNPDEQLAAFDEGRIDLGLSRAIPRDRRSHFVERSIYTDYLLAALPGNHSLAKESTIRLKRMAGEPFIMFHRPGAPCVFDETIAMCRRAGFSPEVVQQPKLLATVITLIESGLGVSLVPGCARMLPNQSVAFRPLEVRSKPIDLYAAWLKTSESPTLKAFLDILSDHGSSIREQMECPIAGKKLAVPRRDDFSHRLQKTRLAAEKRSTPQTAKRVT